MKLELKDYGLTKYRSHLWIGFSKCGLAYNRNKFYRNNAGDMVGYESDPSGEVLDLCFNII